MRPAFCRRTMRTTAWVVLGVWLFALAAGMANACLLEPPGPNEHASHVPPARDDNDHVSAGNGTTLHDQHRHGHQDLSKAPCVKVCGDATQSPIQKTSDLAGDLPALPSDSAQCWSVPLAMHDGIGDRADPRRVPPDPPPRLKYSRLAL